MDNNKTNYNNIPELSQEKNILGKWASFFINRFRVVYLLIAAIVIWGMMAYFQMPKEVNPDVVLPYGYVLTTYVGAAPEEVESLITDKIEKKMEEIDNVKSITSSSGYGVSTVFLEFESNVDVDEMVEKMREKISTVQNELPDDADTPSVDSFEANDSPIMIVNLSGDYDFVDLKKFGETLKDEIESIGDVSEVQIIGGLDREIKVIIDPQKLASYNISLDQINNAIKASNINFPGGDIELDSKNYNIRTVGQFEEVKQLENVVITYLGNNPLYLRDIAHIEDGYKKVESYSRMSHGLNTENPSVKKSLALSVMKKESVDVIEISKKIHNLLDQTKGNLFPDDLSIDISGDMSVYVEDELGAVFNNAKSGLFLVIIVLFLFIGLSEALVVAFVIPLALLVATGLMNVRDMTFNTITLFSLILAVGMLVDNGIVVMENIDRLRFKGLTAKIAAEAGTNQIAPAIAASTLTTLAAFFPIALTPGIMGQFIRPIPITVIFALASSFIIAVTITPALSSRMLKKHRSEAYVKKHPFMEKAFKSLSVLGVFILSMFAFKDSGESFGFLSYFFSIVFSIAIGIKLFKSNTGHNKENDHPIIKRYGNILYSIVKSRKKKLIVLAIVFGAFIFSILLVPLGILKVEMFSQTDYTRLYINIRTPKGTTLDVTSSIAEEVEKRLFDIPEIESFVSNVGITGADSLESFTISTGSTPNRGRIIIDLYEEKDRERTSMEVAADLRTRIEDIPGARIEVDEVEDGPPSDPPVTIRIKGKSLELLNKTAEDFAEILKKIPGTRDVRTSVDSAMPELQVKVHKSKAASMGLNDMTVALGIRNAVHGLESTTFRQNQDEIDVVIRTSAEEFKSIYDLEKIYFYNRFGHPIPFSQVAEIIETKSFTSISHEESKRTIRVYSDVNTNIVPGDIVDTFKKSLNNYPLPQNITVEYGGEMEDVQETFTDMFVNMIIAAILVYIILSVQFNSLSQPLIILFSVPLALIGVMNGLVLTGNNFGFVAFVGVVALVGIAVNDAIVLVDYINYLRQNGYAINNAIKETGMTRFNPVMATTITTIGGILPITLKQPFFGPMGYSLIFGLGMATILTLVIVPILYSLFEGAKTRFRKKDTESGRVNNEKTITDINNA